MPQSISLYFHIPFCVKKCRYCDFYSVSYSNSDNIIDSFINAILIELELISNQYNIDNYQILTLFIGGGTPSVLSVSQMAKLTKGISSTLPLSSEIEWTLECNPESYSPEKANSWIDSGINRLSLGIQSLNKKELSLLGRVHDNKRVYAVLNDSQLCKFRSVSLDLLYGIPGQTTETFRQTLNQAMMHSYVNHISCYELTISEQTRFGFHKKLLPLLNEESISELESLICTLTKKNGFYRYEVSNFAKPGFECRHNLRYWRHAQYIGLGPGAHSFINGKRHSNIRNLSTYLSEINQKKLPVEQEEVLSAKDISHESIFLGLRTAEGINVYDYTQNTGLNFFTEERINIIHRLSKEGYLEVDPNFVRCTVSGMQYADAIARMLF